MYCTFKRTLQCFQFKKNYFYFVEYNCCNLNRLNFPNRRKELNEITYLYK